MSKGECSMFFDEFIRFIKNGDNFDQFFKEFSSDDYNHYKKVIMNNPGNIFPRDFFNNCFSACPYPQLVNKTTWVGIDYDNCYQEYDSQTDTYTLKYKGEIYKTQQDAILAGAKRNPMLVAFDFKNPGQVYKTPVNIWHLINGNIHDYWCKYQIRPNRIYITDYDGFRVCDSRQKLLYELEHKGKGHDHLSSPVDDFTPYAFKVDDDDPDIIYVSEADNNHFNSTIHNYNFEGITKEQILKYVNDGIIMRIQLAKVYFYMKANNFWKV